jgi:Zn-dependent protease with chaperone function
MTNLAHLVDVYGRQLVVWLGTTNEWAFGLLVGALLLDHLLARRVRASWRIGLYAPMALRLLLPPSWAPRLTHAPAVVTLLTPVPMDLPAPAEVLHAAPSWGWPAAILLAYAIVSAWLAYRIVGQRAHALRIARAARPVTGELARLGLPCPLLVHEDAGPMVVGLGSPRIVVPARLLETVDAFALGSVLRHERAHVERRDAWLSASMQLALVLFWPVVSLWAASWRVRQLMEIACDEGALGAADAAERRHYGHALLDLAEWRSIALTPMSAELHFGSTLRARIEALAWTKRWPLAVQAALVAVVAVAFGACSSVAPGPQSVERVSARSASGAAGWTAPPANEALWSVSTEKHGAPSDSLETYCGPIVERVRQRKESWRHWEADWMTVPTDGVPAEQVAFCRSPRTLEVVRMHYWSAEARNGLGQIAKDTVAAFAQRRAQGNPTLCPADPARAPGARHVPHPEDAKRVERRCRIRVPPLRLQRPDVLSVPRGQRGAPLHGDRPRPEDSRRSPRRRHDGLARRGQQRRRRHRAVARGDLADRGLTGPGMRRPTGVARRRKAIDGRRHEQDGAGDRCIRGPRGRARVASRGGRVRPRRRRAPA